MKKITLVGDLLTVNGKEVHIGDYSLVHEALTELLKHIVTVDKNAPIANQMQDMVDHYWAMLRTLESKCTDETPIDKHYVEAGYKIWNKLFNGDLKPVWKQ